MVIRLNFIHLKIYFIRPVVRTLVHTQEKDSVSNVYLKKSQIKKDI